MRGFIIDGKEGARKNLRFGFGLDLLGHTVGIIGSSAKFSRLTTARFRDGFYYYPENSFTEGRAEAITFGNVVIGNDGLYSGKLSNDDLQLLDRHERAHFQNQSNFGPYYLPLHILSQGGGHLFGFKRFLEYRPFLAPGYECIADPGLQGC